MKVFPKGIISSSAPIREVKVHAGNALVRSAHLEIVAATSENCGKLLLQEAINPERGVTLMNLVNHSRRCTITH